MGGKIHSTPGADVTGNEESGEKRRNEAKILVCRILRSWKEIGEAGGETEFLELHISEYYQSFTN
jgi:hypothetical protein